MRSEVVASIEDSAEVFAVSFRMTERLHRQMPEIMRVLLNEGVRILSRDERLAPRALRRHRGAVAADRFDIDSASSADGCRGSAARSRSRCRRRASFLT
ncbi:hypothetical protein [Nocardioides immobilis]|nr:hypothetical protein [Nocardioides immobilis]